MWISSFSPPLVGVPHTSSPDVAPEVAPDVSPSIVSYSSKSLMGSLTLLIIVVVTSVAIVVVSVLPRYLSMNARDSSRNVPALDVQVLNVCVVSKESLVMIFKSKITSYVHLISRILNINLTCF